MNEQIHQRIKKIKFVIFDIDGIFTDGRLWFLPDGQEIKVFHVHDGLGIKRLQRLGIPVGVISSRESQAVYLRMKELGINYIFLGQADKLKTYSKLRDELNLSDEQIAYMGDDLPDLPVMLQVGLAITVPNGTAAIQSHSHWQTTTSGGNGAVREVCDKLIEVLGLFANRPSHD